ncbi:MAG TPA: PEP-CTERM sorting domain-containing protein, partial [Tepidisphaeraceae bacterium]
DATDLTFTVDSNNFINNPSYPTRGYPIDLTSFKLKFPTFEIGLQDPYPAGAGPYFVIRNNDPAVDGFFVSTGTGFFEGVPVNQVGGFGNFGNEFHATYPGSYLSSLDVLGALGHYDFTGLSVFNWTLDDGPFNALGIIYSDMTISVPEPTSIALLGLAGAAAMARRRSRS